MDSHEHTHRVADAKCTSLRNRIRDDLRVSESLADLIVDEWEAEATRRGLGRFDAPYWSEGARWIARRFWRRDRLD